MTEAERKRKVWLLLESILVLAVEGPACDAHMLLFDDIAKEARRALELLGDGKEEENHDGLEKS